MSKIQKIKTKQKLLSKKCKFYIESWTGKETNLSILNDVDPFSLDPIPSIPKERLFYKPSHSQSNTYYVFDCCHLAEYLKHGLQFCCPFTRQPFSKQELIALDQQNQNLKTEAPLVSQLFDKADELNKKEKERLSYLECIQQECIEVLNFYIFLKKTFPSICENVFRQSFLPYLLFLYQKMILIPCTKDEMNYFQKTLSFFKFYPYENSFIIHLPIIAKEWNVNCGTNNSKKSSPLFSYLNEFLKDVFQMMNREPTNPIDHYTCLLEALL